MDALAASIGCKAGGAAGRWAARAGRAGELLASSRRAAVEGLALQPVALPDGVVGVLERQLGQRRGLAVSERVVERASSRMRTPSDQPSETMWCMRRGAARAACRSRQSRAARMSGPRAEVEGPFAPRRRSVCATSAWRSSSGQEERSIAVRGEGQRRGDDLDRPSVLERRNVVRSDSWRRTTSSRACAGARSSRAARRAGWRSGML